MWCKDVALLNGSRGLDGWSGLRGLGRWGGLDGWGGLKEVCCVLCYRQRSRGGERLRGSSGVERGREQGGVFSE